MQVKELVEILETMPQDAWIDVMFPNDMGVYNIVNVERFTLNQGGERVIFDISGDVPLKAV